MKFLFAALLLSIAPAANAQNDVKKVERVPASAQAKNFEFKQTMVNGKTVVCGYAWITAQTSHSADGGASSGASAAVSCVVVPPSE